MMKSFELDAKIRAFGLSKKQFASYLGVHYQTVFGWLTERSQVSSQAVRLLNDFEEEFNRAFEYSYRFLESEFCEPAKAYAKSAYIPLFETLAAYKRYGTDERDPAYPIDFYQMLAFSVARAWRVRKTDTYVIGIDAGEYERWCTENKEDFMLDKNLIQWMKIEISRRSGTV